MRVMRAAVVGVLLAAVAACSTPSAPVPPTPSGPATPTTSATSAPAPTYEVTEPTVWLCRPGLDDNPCEGDLDTTVVAPDATTKPATGAKK